MARGRRHRRPEAPGPAGFLIVDKPRGWTSHDVVDAARGWLSTRRVGHLGTLDPLATGTLPLAVRSATKLVPFLEGAVKAYAGTIRLGVETDTLDAEGVVLRRWTGEFPSEAAIRDGLASFEGDIEQIPPMYSAVKRDGVPLHKLARDGIEVPRKPKAVHVERFALLGYEPPDLQIEVVCSAGTYVRTLAADLGTRLACGAHLASLRRTRSGPFDLSQAATPEDLEREATAGKLEQRLLPPAEALGFPRVPLSAPQARDVGHGREIDMGDLRLTPGSRVCGLEPGGELLAVLEVEPGRRLRPLRVLAREG